MKLTIVVVLAVVTLAACSIPSAFTKANSKKGKNCICREKECTDVSCEEKNCLCVNKALKVLQDQKDCKYPKKWVSTYLVLVQERCLCIHGCQKICSPEEFIKCSSAAYDRFLCKYQEWFEGICDDKEAERFSADIRRLNAECINKDCKPICSGNTDCDPFTVPPKDCGRTKECLKKLILSLSNLLQNEEVKEELSEFSIYGCAYYDQLMNCKHLPGKSQLVCTVNANEEIARAHGSLFNNLVKIAGPCTAISIMSTLKQGALECALKKK